MQSINDVASISVLIKYTHNNQINNDIVPFKVYEQDGSFIAIPYISEEDRTKMQLPEQIRFKMISNKIVAITESHREVILSLATEIRLLQMTL